MRQFIKAIQHMNLNDLWYSINLKSCYGLFPSNLDLKLLTISWYSNSHLYVYMLKAEIRVCVGLFHATPQSLVDSFVGFSWEL